MATHDFISLSPSLEGHAVPSLFFSRVILYVFVKSPPSHSQLVGHGEDTQCPSQSNGQNPQGVVFSSDGPLGDGHAAPPKRFSIEGVQV